MKIDIIRWSIAVMGISVILAGCSETEDNLSASSIHSSGQSSAICESSEIYKNFFKNDESLERELEISKVGTSVYNIEQVYEQHNIVMGTDFTYIRIVTRAKDFEYIINAQSLAFPDDIDFSTHTLVICYGRELEELKCRTTTKYDGSHELLTIVFQENYQGNIAFFYLIDEANYVPPSLSSDLYIMNGSDKVNIRSLRELNAHNPLEYRDETE